jgi:hypothetical protein
MEAKGPRFVGAALETKLVDLPAEAQTLDDLLVLGRVRRLQVVEELAALVHELHEPAARRVVALVCAEVLTEAVDALGKLRNLDLWRAGVFGVTAKLRNDVVLGSRHAEINLLKRDDLVLISGADSTGHPAVKQGVRA